MGRELDRLRKKSDMAFQKAEETLEQREIFTDHLQQICDEYFRTTELAGQAGYLLNEIDEEFQKKTKLSKIDIILLFLCTAIQCARQYLLSNEKLRLSDDKKGDKFMESIYDNTIGNLAPPTAKEILFQSVPYDAIKRGDILKNNESLSPNLAGSNHRSRTLGHDPVLGWIFGTANIMTRSLTKYNFETYQVKDMKIIRHYPNGCPGMLSKTIEYSTQDKKLLFASIARQAIHFGTDFFTKQGLPVPGIMVADHNLAEKMISKGHIDTYSILRGATLAILINELISCVHKLFYDEKKHGSPEMYEVITRKILSYSNLLATSSNVIVTAITKDATKLDVGGMIVTIYRLISDYKFINDVKQDFLKNNMYDKIIGNDYSFI